MQISRYWNIVVYRALAGVKAESRQNYLGYGWYLLEPVLSTVILYFAFSKVMGRGGADYVMFLLVGLTTWQWYEGACLQAATSLRSKLHILQHFDLPKFLFPLVTVLVSSWKYLCVTAVVVASLAVVGHRPGLNYLWLPAVMGCELLLILSVAVPLAVIVTYANDAMTIATSSFRILFFVSGIFFDPDKVPEAQRGWFYANPIAGIIESFRNIFLKDQPPNWDALLRGAIQSAILLALGLWLCHRVNRRIMKHVAF
jgi:ABC-type polysaccharide/polyol phosphate export permease